MTLEIQNLGKRYSRKWALRDCTVKLPARHVVALAFAKRPDLMLLVDPLASMDPLALRNFLRALIGETAEHGLTVLLSSHIIGDLERVCDYLIILSDARV